MVYRQPFLRATTLLNCFADNLTVQWGAQDHYEIVRKVGRGKYSEVSPMVLMVFCRAKHSNAGIRGHPHRQRREMYC